MTKRILAIIALSISHLVIHGQTSNTITNQIMVQGQGSGTNAYLIATTPADNNSDADHLHLVATFNCDAASNCNSTLDATFGNRGGFNGVYSAKGANPTGLNVHLAAYRQADSTTNIYLIMADYWDIASYSVLENAGETVVTSPSPINLTTNTLPGTLVFDTASSSYPPTTYSDFSGNTYVQGTSGTLMEVRGAGTPEMRISSTSGFGPAKLSFFSDRGLGTEWRPGFIQSADNGNYTGRLDFYTNGTGNQMNTLLGMSLVNGSLGIGTTTPANTLSVAGDEDIAARLKFDNPGAYGGSSAVLALNGGAGNKRFLFYDYIAQRPLMTINDGAAGGGVLIGSGYITSAGTPNPAPTNGLAVQGNVGIGTTSPGAQLDVNGSIRISASNGALVFPDGSSLMSAKTPSFSGNVGIGTSSPSSALTVAASNGAIELVNSAASNEHSYLGTYPTMVQLAYNRVPSTGTILNASESSGFLNMVGGTGAAAVDVNLQAAPSGQFINVFHATGAGTVGIGTSTPNSTLEVNGNITLTQGSGASIKFPDGTVQSTAWTGSLCGGDYAEAVDVSGDRAHYAPGDVLVIDSNNPGRFLKSVEPYSTGVTGIYSTKPGLIGRRQKADEAAVKLEVPMAMIGIVPVKVSAENGPIKPGDFLVTSSMIGRAMKGTDRSRMFGAVVGKALGTLDQGTGVIEAVVSLQ